MSEKVSQLVLPISIDTEALKQRVAELMLGGMKDDEIVKTISDELIMFVKYGKLVVKEVLNVG